MFVRFDNCELVDMISRYKSTIPRLGKHRGSYQWVEERGVLPWRNDWEKETKNHDWEVSAIASASVSCLPLRPVNLRWARVSRLCWEAPVCAHTRAHRHAPMWFFAYQFIFFLVRLWKALIIDLKWRIPILFPLFRSVRKGELRLSMLQDLHSWGLGDHVQVKKSYFQPRE